MHQETCKTSWATQWETMWMTPVSGEETLGR